MTCVCDGSTSTTGAGDAWLSRAAPTLPLGSRESPVGTYFEIQVQGLNKWIR